ncbi:MAG: hypothetical protein JWO85_1345 [Candidatus Eremiobacteraeota bacterium]|jgi:hypothetical protein|nr:hypothetical protein [Candidatus Eremiobacteraeota bacterium]
MIGYQQDTVNRHRAFLIEFNELCPTLLARFIAAGDLPYFAVLRNTSDVFTTDAGETGATLVPWIQWPSVHTGLPYAEHAIFHLGDATEAAFPTIASLLAEAGIPVGVFGGMNVPAPRTVRGFLLPDPWDKRGRTTPASLQPYYDVVAEQVKESSHHGRLGLREVAKLGAFYARHGFRASTALTIARQFAAERIDPGLKWRRAALLDQVQYDVFRTYVREQCVRFASFFSNSTAHYQHLYWRNMEPALFADPPNPGAHRSLREAIRYGYRSMDALIGRFFHDFPDATLIFATALSQEPYTGPVVRYYRPTNFEALLAFLGVEGGSVAPVMSHQYHVDFAGEAEAANAEGAFRALAVDGQPVVDVRREGSGLFCGCHFLDPRVMERDVVDTRKGTRRRFAELFFLMDGYRSGQHKADGALWIRTGGRGRVHWEPVSILSIAPTILALFGITPPSTMRGAVLPLDCLHEHAAIGV